MCELEKITEENKEDNGAQKGSAIVLALFVLALIGAFVALALTRTSTEAAALGNETAEGRTFYAAQGSLEMMTRNFTKVFGARLNPLPSDLAKVEDGDNVPGLSTATGGNYTFTQELHQTSQSRAETLSGGPFAGLFALRDTWRLRTTTTDTRTNTQVQLTRNVLNNRIPIFQFGVFYDDDLELFNGPRFGFGGRVHSNRHFFLHPSNSGAYFDSRVTAAGQIITQTKRNGDTVNITGAQTWIRNASNVYVQLRPDEGSVLNGTPNLFGSGEFYDPQLPASRRNPAWSSTTAKFDGNIVAETKVLKLPIQVGANQDLIEILRRGKAVGDVANNGASGGAEAVEAVATANTDNEILRAERFANKTGIRVSLADRKERLPGCATTLGTAVTAECGVRLDGNPNGLGLDYVLGNSKGYQPLGMKLTSSDGGFNYLSTRVNGERFGTGGLTGGNVLGGSARETWIKIETVDTDPVTYEILTKDITKDILSMGVTEQAPSGLAITGYNHTAPDNVPNTGSNITATTARSPSQGTDSRSVIKIQRFAIPGVAIPNRFNVLTSSSGLNFVMRFDNLTSTQIPTVPLGCTGCSAADVDAMTFVEPLRPDRERNGQLKVSAIGGVNRAIVPFPIQMFDTREGMYYDQKSATYYNSSTFSNFQKLPDNGVMSMIDIDVANLRRFLRGDFDGLFNPNTPFGTSVGRGLRSTDIPSKSGWVLYLSDRRGDYDFDGALDMEDIYGAAPGNDGNIQPGEDLDKNNILAARYGTETERYSTAPVWQDVAAVTDHKYYRRGFRLINGQTLPGLYDSATPTNTKGFTVASENGVYIRGNYNATGVGTVPSSGNTPYDEFYPFDTPVHIPASVVADAVSILSNSWDDSRSFTYPWDLGSRVASTTQVRFAMISGDTITSLQDSPNQGGSDPRLNGGLHNFKRFLEQWTSARLDYTGSLINLYNSRNNNGAFKCCATVYGAPRRNWVFDSTFLNPSRLPPGTPFFQYVQTTGFERTNR